MGYVLRVRLASFFTGAATASFLGLYILYKDYKVAHESIAQRHGIGYKISLKVVFCGLNLPNCSRLGLRT
ncbi:hypothetical protein Goklo_013928 [Gossypium klotzschianum]|uniref:Uncharacterized protein n=1 Tax=Gossypium klotzschianum TaxID=34286 RepID=A0A7J8U5Y2_9ROSI|nr:hypothetical protein [Gossypium klotzschianum]